MSFCPTSAQILTCCLPEPGEDQWKITVQVHVESLLTEVESRIVLDLIGQIGHGIAI